MDLPKTTFSQCLTESLLFEVEGIVLDSTIVWIMSDVANSVLLLKFVQN